MGQSTSDKKGITIQSLNKAMDILDVIADSAVPLKAAELSRITGINPTTIYGILNTLEQRLVIEKNPSSNTYSLGTQALRLGLAYQRNSPYVRIGTQHAVRYASQFPEYSKDVSNRIAMLDGVGEVLSIELVSPNSRPGLRPQIYTDRSSLPVLSSSSGKVLLAYMESELREIFIKRHSIVLTESNRREIEKIINNGYATDFDESIPGMSCVAAPIYQRNGKVNAAISFSGNTRFIKAHTQELASHIKIIARLISTELGYMG